MTALARILRQAIRSDGPITVERYMSMALGDPMHGYYMTRDPFGPRGDFVTAPEISQMFGELIGLWAADLWMRMGAPHPVRLVELGPGRGTLMCDFLRAALAAPGFRNAVDLHLIETSPVLKEKQDKALMRLSVAPTWARQFDAVPPGPAIILANEFFDALPIRQYVRASDGWRERLVGLDSEDRFIFVASPVVEPVIKARAPQGAILELAADGLRLAAEIAGRLAEQGGAALVIDYGSTQSTTRETLQALQNGAPADPLAAPGEADLTAHVDFAALAQAARRAGACVHGPVEQGAFLRNLGVEARAAQLSRRAREAQRASIQAALERLTDQSSATAMGTLFKALAMTSATCPVPAGFEEAA